MKQRGFTVIEIVVVAAFLVFAGSLFFVQKHNLEVANRDDRRKTAINAMYYGLEEAFYKQNGYYPQTIDANTLKTVESSLFTDPNGITLGQTSKDIDGETVPVQSDYRYEPVGCTDKKCTGYTLRAQLEGEADFVKKSRK